MALGGLLMGIIIAGVIWYLVTYRDAIDFKGIFDCLFEFIMIALASVIFSSGKESKGIKDIVNM